MKICPKCNVEYDDKFGFCRQCGVSLVKKNVETVRPSFSKNNTNSIQHNKMVNSSNNSNIIIALLIFIILFGAGFGYYYFNNKVQNLETQVKKQNIIISDNDKVLEEQKKKLDDVKETLSNIESENSTSSVIISQQTPIIKTSIVSNDAISGVYHSSVDIENGYAHSADLAFDGNIKSCWSEGVVGWGIGEFITVFFDNTYIVNGLNIWIGHQKTPELFYKNGRPLAIRVVGSDGFNRVFRLRDVMGMQRVNFPYSIKVNNIKIIIADVAIGNTYQDTCIAEVSFF